MLNHSYRLTVEKFNQVMEKGRVSHSPLFLVRILRDQADIRISAVAPKKVSKTAVGRNKIRRKIYEATRTYKHRIIPGLHVIIFAKPTVLKATQKEIVADLEDIFVKSKLIR